MVELKRPLSEPSLCIGRAEFWFDEMMVAYSNDLFNLVLNHANCLDRIHGPEMHYTQNDFIQGAYKKWLEEKEIDNLILNEEIMGMNKKTITVSIEISAKSYKQLEHTAQDRGYETAEQYMAKAIDSKLDGWFVDEMLVSANLNEDKEG